MEISAKYKRRRCKMYRKKLSIGSQSLWLDPWLQGSTLTNRLGEDMVVKVRGERWLVVEIIDK